MGQHKDLFAAISRALHLSSLSAHMHTKTCKYPVQICCFASPEELGSNRHIPHGSA